MEKSQEIKPLHEPLVCPKCGCKDIEEVTDDVCITTAFTWDEKLNRYKEYDKDTDGNGSTWLQCRECGYEYSYEILEQFNMSNPEYQ